MRRPAREPDGTDASQPRVRRRCRCGASTATMISFLIPAYDEEAFIGDTIASIRAAAAEVIGDGAGWELIVADDASTDQTAAIAAAAGARVVAVNRRQIAAARNAAARASRGDRLIFVDADTRVDPAILRETLAAFDAGAAGGAALAVFDG